MDQSKENNKGEKAIFKIELVQTEDNQAEASVHIEGDGETLIGMVAALASQKDDVFDLLSKAVKTATNSRLLAALESAMGMSNAEKEKEEDNVVAD